MDASEEAREFDFSFHSFKPRDSKHSLLLPSATASRVSEKEEEEEEKKTVDLFR